MKRERDWGCDGEGTFFVTVDHRLNAKPEPRPIPLPFTARTFGREKEEDYIQNFGLAAASEGRQS